MALELVMTLPGMVPSMNEIRRMNRWDFAAFVNEWKGTAALVARDAVNKTGWKAPEFAIVTVVFHFPDERRHDPDNYVAGLKGVMDGLVKGGAIVDDDFEHIRLVIGYWRKTAKAAVMVSVMEGRR